MMESWNMGSGSGSIICIDDPSDNLLKFSGIIGKNPLHPPVDFPEQAIFGSWIAGADFLSGGTVL